MGYRTLDQPSYGESPPRGFFTEEAKSLPQFEVTGVSQTAGKAAGGTVIHVTAVGIIGTPTSTLGTVTNVAVGGFDITTNAHTAGAVSWTCTNGNGHVSTPRTYTYLAPPGAPALTPNNGPQTLATAGVDFTCTGLPPTLGTGCPIAATVGGVAVTSVAQTGASDFTCTVQPVGASGAQNAQVTVDGAAGTIAVGAWTANPPPTDISSTNVATNGGTGVITGLNFVNGCTASVNINGTPTNLNVTFVTSAKLNFVLPSGTYTQGTWPLTVTNPDGQSDTEPIFEIVSVLDPQAIIGANMYAWYRADSGITQAGGLVSQWNDKGPNAINMTATGTQRPTFVASSTHGFAGQPTVLFDGVANTLLNTTTAAALGSNTIFIYIVARYGTATTNTVAAYAQPSTGAFTLIQCVGATFSLSYGGVASVSRGAVSTASPSGVYAYVQGTAASAENLGINAGNMTEGTTTGTQTQPGSGAMQLYLGSRASAGATFANVEIAEVIYANARLNATQLNELYSYFNFRYAIDTTLAFTSAMNVMATTGTESRISGAGFNTTTSVQVVVGGTPQAVTTTLLSSTSVSISGLPSLSAGDYDLIITNASSGAALFVSNGLSVIATSQPDTIFGRNLIVWNRCDKVTLNGSTVAALTDLACAGWSLQNATAADQPTYNATDANFNNQPSMSFTGSPMFLSAAGGVGDQNAKTMWFLIVCKPRSAQLGKFLACAGVGTFRITIDGGGTWGVSNGGSQASDGAAGTALAKMEWRSSDAGGGNQTIGCARNFGTEGTVTQAGNMNWGTVGTFYLASQTGTAAFGLFDIVEVIGLDIVPAGSPLTAFQTYLSTRYGF